MNERKRAEESIEKMELKAKIDQEVLAKIKLVCSDVDGTLVEDGKGNLNPAYYDEIRRLKKKGIGFAVVSGRSYESTRILFEPVLEDVLFINDNGAVIRYQEEIILSHVMEPQLVWEIVKEMEERPGCATYVSAMQGSYARKENQPFCDLLRTDYQLEVIEVEKMPHDLPTDAGVMCFGLYHPVDAQKAAGEEFITRWNNHPKIEVVSAGIRWLNICQKGIHKGSALAEVMKQYGLEKEEVIAFGDNMNDYGMLSFIPNSVAIGNARQEIKDISRYVADTNTNDGVLQIMKML